jgi:hypothetical protein
MKEEKAEEPQNKPEQEPPPIEMREVEPEQINRIEEEHLDDAVGEQREPLPMDYRPIE